MPRPHFVLAGLLVTIRIAAATGADLQVTPGTRLLVVAPHPDDETLGAAGLIERVLATAGTVHVVLVTAGDGYVEAVMHETGTPRPRPSAFVAYGERRLAETRAALRVLGGERILLRVLGFPDGGLEALLRAHWRRQLPERSATTEAARPPYPEAIAPDEGYDGDDLRRQLTRLLRDADPTIVALPDPVDRHPDHRAAAVFTLLALQSRLAERSGLPLLLAYLVHWPGWPPGWDAPSPSAASEGRPLALPESLPARGLVRRALALDPAARARKREALARYVSQQAIMPAFLASFVRASEPFTVLTEDVVRRADELVPRVP
jgi:LmbE family N-acetylglucosaminyl deacetylase